MDYPNGENYKTVASGRRTITDRMTYIGVIVVEICRVETWTDMHAWGGTLPPPIFDPTSILQDLYAYLYI